MEIWSFPQILGYIAFCAGVFAFLQKVDVRLKFFSAMECFLMIAHFYLLDNHTAAVMVSISAVRNISSIFTQSRVIAGVFVLIGLAGGIYTAQYWYSFLIIMSQVASTIALFTLRGLNLRYVFVFAASCWLVNNILTKSIGGVALEIFILAANISTIVRLRREKRLCEQAVDLRVQQE